MEVKQTFGTMYQGIMIKWCECGLKILTSEQIRNKKPCNDCQKKHAEGFHRKYDIGEEKKDADTERSN